MTLTSRRTPLWESHIAAGARMTEFAGWELPVSYDGIVAEHRRTRSRASLFDTCHMGRFAARGAASLDDLSRIVTVDLRRMDDSSCRYGFLLRDDGGVLDDLIVYRFGAARWMIVVNAATRARDLEWIRAHAGGGTEVEDVSAALGKIDVQGPAAVEAAAQATGMAVGRLGRFRFLTGRLGGCEAVVSRTGYTGEDGCEVYAPPAEIVRLWRALARAGVAPAGLGARDTLRLEAGLPLYGHELSERVSPVHARLERFAAKPEPFVGREAVERMRREGVGRLLCGFRTAGRQTARAGNRVYAGGAEAGEVTSGSFSPTLEAGIGMAYVAGEQAVPGQPIRVDTGRGLLDAVVTPLPFHRGSRPVHHEGG